MLSEEIKENATAIIMGILDNHGVRHCDRINNRVCLIFCEYAGIHINIKIRVNGQVDAWTYTEKPVPTESRIFVLELLNTFHSANHEIQAYINEDNLIIFKKAFSCIESGSVSEHAISSNLEAFFGQTIHHKQIHSR